MRIILVFSFVFFAQNYFSQIIPYVTVNISSDELIKARSIYQLLPDFPVDCAIKRFEITAKKGQMVITIPEQGGDTLEGKNEWRNAIKDLIQMWPFLLKLNKLLVISQLRRCIKL